MSHDSAPTHLQSAYALRSFCFQNDPKPKRKNKGPSLVTSKTRNVLKKCFFSRVLKFFRKRSKIYVRKRDTFQKFPYPLPRRKTVAILPDYQKIKTFYFKFLKRLEFENAPTFPEETSHSRTPGWISEKTDLRFKIKPCF